MPKLIMEHQPGDKIEKVLLVRQSQLKTSRNGSQYIDMELADKSGTLSAKMWNTTSEMFDVFVVDDFIAVRGYVQDFKGQKQLIIDSVIWQDPAEIDIADFLPQSTRDIDMMLAETEQFADGISHPKLHELVRAILSDERIRKGFRTAPAAVRYHHAWIGGLLEHTLGVCQLAAFIIEQHPELDADLLIAAAILHDIGKIDEFTYERSFRYSDQGGLIGHTAIAVSMIEKKAREIDGFPGELLGVLLHLVLSHHGAHEFGAPILPVTAEAVALHHCDNIDAKLNAFARIVREDANPNSNWTEWSRMFERRLFKWQRQTGEE